MQHPNQLLENAITHILKVYPFYGGMLQCLTISWGEYIPTLGVMYNPEKKTWQLLINTKFFVEELCDGIENQEGKKISGLEARIAILLHEIYHILHKHPIRYNELVTEDNARNRMMFNFAADLAINQLIKNIPKWGLDINHKDFKFPKNKPTETYYRLLQKKYPELPPCQSCGGSGEKSEDQNQGLDRDWET